MKETIRNREDRLRPFHILIGITYLGFTSPDRTSEEKETYKELLDCLVQEHNEMIEILNRM